MFIPLYINIGPGTVAGSDRRTYYALKTRGMQ